MKVFQIKIQKYIDWVCFLLCNNVMPLQRSKPQIDVEEEKKEAAGLKVMITRCTGNVVLICIAL